MPERGRRLKILSGVLFSILAVAVLVLFPKWKMASENGGQKPAEPFRIAGNSGNYLTRVAVVILVYPPPVDGMPRSRLGELIAG